MYKKLILIVVAGTFFSVVKSQTPQSAAPITVTGEVVIPATDKGFCTEISERYTNADGLRRIRYIRNEAQSDISNGMWVQYSYDNGRTWGAKQDVFGKHKIVAPDKSWDITHHAFDAYTYNPVHRHFVGIGMQRISRGGQEAAYNAKWSKGKSEYTDHCYLLLRNDNETELTESLVRFEDGPEFDPADPLNDDFFEQNACYFSNPYVAKNGDILFPVNISSSTYYRLMGIDINNCPSNSKVSGGMLVFRGVWNGSRYDLTVSSPTGISDLLSARGIGEPTIAELESGRILVVFRASNEIRPEWNTRTEPGTPSFKWYCYSDDGGKTFTPPAPWHFDDGEVIYSPGSISHFIRHSGNGKLYWVGNITGHRVDGSHPRWPLKIVEVDEKYGTAIKASQTVIDTKRDWEGEHVQLSNFYMLEDRESKDIELWLTKFGQHGDNDVWRAEAWKYRITVK